MVTGIGKQGGRIRIVSRMSSFTMKLYFSRLFVGFRACATHRNPVFCKLRRFMALVTIKYPRVSRGTSVFRLSPSDLASIRTSLINPGITRRASDRFVNQLTDFLQISIRFNRPDCERLIGETILEQKGTARNVPK